MKILILGASGMLGSSLFRYFSRLNGFDSYGTIRSGHIPSCYTDIEKSKLIIGVDIENSDSLINLMEKIRPDLVINCVGLIKQLESVEDPLKAIPINSLYPHRLASLCGLVNSRLIHISTDCVFSGEVGAYAEDDLPDAKDLYGRTKYLGEVVNRENAITLRTSIIGHELNSNRSLVNWFLSQDGLVHGFRRAIYSGLPTVELARVIEKFVIPNIHLNGLFHVASDPISKYELLKIIRDIYSKKNEIIPDDQLKIDRSLNARKFQNATGYIPPSWEELVINMHDFK